MKGIPSQYTKSTYVAKLLRDLDLFDCKNPQNCECVHVYAYIPKVVQFNYIYALLFQKNLRKKKKEKKYKKKLKNKTTF